MKFRKVIGGLLACMVFITAITCAAGATETVAEEMTTENADYEAENLYAQRMQYVQDIILQDAYNLRMEYSSMVSEMYSTRHKLVEYALSFVGVTPYVAGGTSLWWGTDCSGFVRLIFAAFGYWLPSGSDAYQTSVGKSVSWAEMQPGDILVYDWGAHVGIYAGNGLVVHCSSPENGTVVWSCSYRSITKIVRVLPDSETLSQAD